MSDEQYHEEDFKPMHWFTGVAVFVSCFAMLAFVVLPVARFVWNALKGLL